jgi:hypothetical protein
MELMEPETYVRDVNAVELQFPGKWDNSSGIEDFLRATQKNSLRELKKV